MSADYFETLRISRATGYRIEHIERGLAGEDYTNKRYDFLSRLVIDLGIGSSSVAGRYEDQVRIYHMINA